jgi:hypothetical protein
MEYSDSADRDDYRAHRGQEDRNREDRQQDTKRGELREERHERQSGT